MNLNVLIRLRLRDCVERSAKSHWLFQQDLVQLKLELIVLFYEAEDPHILLTAFVLVKHEIDAVVVYNFKFILEVIEVVNQRLGSSRQRECARQ